MLVPHGDLHILVFVISIALYSYAFSKGHFRSDCQAPLTSIDPIFYAVNVQTLLGDNTVKAETPFAKALTAVHALAAFVLTLMTASHVVA